MSERTLVSRRTAIRSIAAAGAAGAVGVGLMARTPEPVAAVDDAIDVDDVTVQTADGKIETIGIQDLWFEADWEGISGDLGLEISLSGSGGTWSTTTILATEEGLGVDESGLETFGFGDAYEDNYEVDLTDTHDIEVPLYRDVTSLTDRGRLSFEEDSEEDELTADMSLNIELTYIPEGEEEGDSLGTSSNSFKFTHEWVEGDGEATDGEADIYTE